MEIRIKLLSDLAKVPKYSKSGDAALDLTAVDVNYIQGEDERLDYIEYSTGIAIEIPDGYVGLIYPRSSISTHDLMLCNHVGVIDSGYRGEIKLRFKITDRIKSEWVVYEVGERIGQLIIMPYPKVFFTVSESLDETSRGDSGWGSSGN